MHCLGCHRDRLLGVFTSSFTSVPSQGVTFLVMLTVSLQRFLLLGRLLPAGAGACLVFLGAAVLRRAGAAVFSPLSNLDPSVGDQDRLSSRGSSCVTPAQRLRSNLKGPGLPVSCLHVQGPLIEQTAPPTAPPFCPELPENTHSCTVAVSHTDKHTHYQPQQTVACLPVCLSACFSACLPVSLPACLKSALHMSHVNDIKWAPPRELRLEGAG